MDRPTPPTVLDLFTTFFLAGIMGFGGTMPMARRMLVEQRRWLTPAEFNDLLALCQFLPGPNVCNMCVALGARYRGVAGSAAGLLGLFAAPFLIVIGLGALYERYNAYPVVRHGFVGLAAAGAGLVVATSVKIAWPIRTSMLAVGLALVVMAAIAFLHLPLLPTMLVTAPISILLYRRFG